jgi:hypothetical protein
VHGAAWLAQARKFTLIHLLSSRAHSAQGHVMTKLLTVLFIFAGLLAAPVAWADQRPGCLPTEPGTIT